MHRAPRLIAAALTVVAVTAVPSAATRGVSGPVVIDGPSGPPPTAVVALIDTGINPYSVAFRDNSKLAQRPPSTYIPGYPHDAQPLRLHLDLPYKQAVKADAKVWASVRPHTLYWIPGTRIIGAISFGGGGTNCSVVDVPPANSVTTNCPDHRILDDHGHGSMTASRAAGSPHSLAPDARIVEIEGLGAGSVRWAASQGWIDVQSNSWVSLVPPPVSTFFAADTTKAFEYASTRTFTFVASGNGTAFVAGFAPTPTYLLSTAPPGVVVVGGHDNGKMTMWAGAPPHVVADAYSGYAAIHDSSGPMRPDPIACCTSAASPYAAGGATAIIEEARGILGDHSTGIHDGVVASGPAGLVAKGPLADGRLTLEELRTVFFHTAEAHPSEGKDDGRIHWLGEPRSPELTPYGPGDNPFCNGCVTTPVEWKSIPDQADAYQLVGYGAINERSVALADKVLMGGAKLPHRSVDDQQYAFDQQLRALVVSGNPG